MKQPIRSLILAAALATPAAGLLVPAAASATPTEAQSCEITFSVAGDATLGAFEAHVDYSASGGDFDGTAGAVACVATVPGAFAFAVDDDARSELGLGMISVVGVGLPQDFWRCTFLTSTAPPFADDFTITVDEALDGDFTAAAVTASVSRIACASEAQCGNGIIEGDEECDDGLATLTCSSQCLFTAGTQRCLIGFNVAGAEILGSLQFGVGYVDAAGDFEGSAEGVACTPIIESTLTASNDRDAQRELRLGLISPSGLTLPVDLWQCSFLTTAPAPVPEDFVVADVEATDLSMIDISVDVTLSNLGCVGAPQPQCGNGQVEGQEACDDGNTVNTDACSNACTIAACGDGIVQPGLGETCDDGNTVSIDACTANCHVAVCGDGIVRAGVEACDDGNTVNTDACSNACTIAACGDGIVQLGLGETCDDANTTSGDGCNAACGDEFCGDGIDNNGTTEQCDDGNVVNTDACSNTCTVAICGDSIVQPGLGETCDDGNTVGTDACTGVCRVAVCGDGIVRTGVEACDDGNAVNTDVCSNTCTVAVCGDGIIQPGLGETCDDGNTVNTDACSNTCTVAICGDGVVQPGLGETCDDGNTVGTDACTAVCRVATCGDGIVRTGVEACDDGNTVNTDACSNACAAAVCGDGIIQPGLGETCDDGDTVSTDLCTSLCKNVECGDVSRDGRVLAGDALQILKQAVGLETGCAAALCVCDTNGASGVTASDALIALKAAVGQSVELNCQC